MDSATVTKATLTTDITDVVVASDVGRMDRGGTLSELASPQSGYLYEGRVARLHPPGDPLSYSWGKEHRDAAELASIVAQLPGKPVVAPPDDVIHHPIDLLKVGAPHKVIGTILSARVDGDHAIAQIFITDPGTIEAIKGGIDELSLGYACRADGDGFQRNTYVDHLAIVPKARCGATCALRIDTRLDATIRTSDPDGMRTDCNNTCSCKANVDAKLNAKERKTVPSESFADPMSRQEPIEDEAHVRAAMSRFGETHFPSDGEKRAAFHRIVAAAKRFGIDAGGFEKAQHMDEAPGDTREPPCACKSDAVNTRSSQLALAPQEPNMDEIQKQLDAAKAEALAQKTRADQAESARDTALAAKDAAELASRESAKDAKAAQGRIDAAEAAQKAAEEKGRLDAAAALDARVAQRVEVLSNAVAVLGAADKDGKVIDRSKTSDLDLMKEIAKRVDGDDAIFDTDGEAEVRVAYRGALKRHAGAAESRAALATAVVQNRAAGAARQDAVNEDASFAAMNAAYRNQKSPKAN